MEDVCEAEGIEMFNIPYSGNGENWGSNKRASGIGWWLNNNQYTASNAGSSSNKRPSNTYDQANGGTLGFKKVDRPIAIRIIGEVTTPEGLTKYDNEDEGGSIGDNGHMARMKNLKNITIEGVGDDAMIHGWGFHFIAGTDARDGQGKSFEVRNLTFYEYPEDAIGMEGQQSGGKITASVERCWIHNNTFLPGHCTNPAESDKKEGDGSVDFKRGMYFTASYNWYEYCHKTNLVGSSDSSLQYNLTYHHNVWWQCGSRIPLLRQANAHFYNNYVMVDQTETTSPYSWVAKPSPSYVHSLRANSYLFSEANYYDGCKNITDGKSGGAAKSWNNIIYANSGTNNLQEVTSREQKVSNKCAYDGTDYSSFDTDSDLFYYNSYLLDYATTARQRAIMFAGANGHGRDSAMNKYTPTTPVVVDDNGTTIQLPTSKGDVEVNGVMFRGITGASSGTVKFKGQGITFTLTAEAQLTVETSTSGDPAPELLDSTGKVYAHKFTGKLTIILPAGTYFIASGQKDKEAVITSMKFDSTAGSSEARVAAAVEAISSLPATAALTDEYATALKAAQNAYNALTTNEKAAFDTDHADLTAKFQSAQSAYGTLQINNVKSLINAIGTVSKTSYDAISKAQKAYNELTAEQQAQLTTEKATLDAALEAWEAFAVENVNDLITAYLSKAASAGNNPDRATLDSLLAEADSIMEAFAALPDDKESEVNNYSSMLSYNNYFEYLDLQDYFVDGTDVTVVAADSETVARLTAAYDALTTDQRDKVKSTYDKIMDAWNEVKPSIVTCYFTRANGNSGDAVIHASEDGVFSFGEKHSGADEKKTITTSDGKTVEIEKALKMESKTELKINLSADATVIIYMTGSNVKVDGTKTNATSNVVTVDLAKGLHSLTKADSTNILYVEVIYK